MNTTVFFCHCGEAVAGRVSGRRVAESLAGTARCVEVDFLCSEEGKEAMRAELEANPAAVVAAACSPREHERTFQGVMQQAGVNPFLLHVVNIREQVAWVTPDSEQATEKAVRAIRAGVARVALQEPLFTRSIEIVPDVVVVGAGPGGLKCAQALAAAGRRVTVIEKTPFLGGMPVRYEELFPHMECGPCLLEPVMGDVMRGKVSENIELMTMSEIAGVVGYQGNFTVKVKTRTRYVVPEICIGCSECIAPCPVSRPGAFDCGIGLKKAIDFPFAGALPNAPYIDDSCCLRFQGEDCTLCRDACPVPEAIVFDDAARIAERSAGAIVLATGFELYDCSRLTEFGYGTSPRIITNLAFERLLAANGPTAGSVEIEGALPQTAAMVHCAGSLDERHVPYCSSVCCSAAFKLSRLASNRNPGMRFVHLYRELVLPGKDAVRILDHARHDERFSFVRYDRMVRVESVGSRERLTFRTLSGSEEALDADLVVLCPPLVPAASAAELARTLDIDLDRYGFFEELQGRTDASQSKRKGIYLAGACQGPMDIQLASSQGMAAAGHVLSTLVEGRKLVIGPVKAVVRQALCSGCRVCVPVCPYKAIDFDLEARRAHASDLLCEGCGTCVAACPSGAIDGIHFTDAQIEAELEELLK